MLRPASAVVVWTQPTAVIRRAVHGCLLTFATTEMVICVDVSVIVARHGILHPALEELR